MNRKLFVVPLPGEVEEAFVIRALLYIGVNLSNLRITCQEVQIQEPNENYRVCSYVSGISNFSGAGSQGFELPLPARSRGGMINRKEGIVRSFQSCRKMWDGSSQA